MYTEAIFYSVNCHLATYLAQRRQEINQTLKQKPGQPPGFLFAFLGQKRQNKIIKYEYKI